MKLLTVLLVLFFLKVQYGSFAKLGSTENQTQEGEQRSVRVQRVSDREFPGNDLRRTESSIEEIVNLRAALLGSGDYFEKLRRDFPNLDNLIQQEARLMEEFIMVVRDLVEEGIITLKNLDLAINEMMNTSAIPTSIKPMSKTDNGLANILNSLEQLDFYQRDGQGNENRENSRIPNRIESVNKLELKKAKTAGQLDNVMVKLHKHLAFVQSVFARICRKHHSTLLTQSSSSDAEKFASMNQPKKVSIL
ncbi:uncharacterized protein LOC117230152 [Bombus vosnesenskii]|uniref:Uncharacterized protein LOC117230152 n=1 Tax=Bombus vosnesenskii TaxID=207650 RepID=A0A6J3JSI3_9HYME|nr:uncharacterized protein LOC117230152 [Bombus vosnesenskii]